MVDIAKNYPELKNYLDLSDETQVTLAKLQEILPKRLDRFPKDKPFHMCDVGSGDGDLTLPLIDFLHERYKRFKLIAIEPDPAPFEKLMERIREKGWNFVHGENLTFQAFLRKHPNLSNQFDFILFSQVFYHFPKEEWEMIFKGAVRLLKDQGLIIIIIDSHHGPAYKLKDLITGGKAVTLEYGDLHSAEDVEAFLDRLDVKYTSISFPIYLYVRDEPRKLEVFTRILCFIYRTFPQYILPKYREQVHQFLEENKRNGFYAVENRIKAIIIEDPKRR